MCKQKRSLEEKQSFIQNKVKWSLFPGWRRGTLDTFFLDVILILFGRQEAAKN